MASEFQITPKKKPKLSIDTLPTANCVFCSKKFTTRDKKIIAEISKLDKIFEASRKREDTVSKIILANEEDIRKENKTLVYHRNCRATFTSQDHIQRKQVEHSLKTSTREHSVSDEGPWAPTTRSKVQKVDTTRFSFLKNCIICGNQCNLKHRTTWSLVQSSVNVHTSNLYSTLWDATEKLGDDSVLVRLSAVPNGDLVAAEARYHRKKDV